MISNTSRARYVTSLVALIATAGLLVSCGSADDSADGSESDDAAATTENETVENDAATSTPTTAAPTTASTAGTTEAAETAAAGTPSAVVAAFSDCMERTGVEVQDLTVDEDGLAKLGDVLRSLDIQDPPTQLALFGCQSSLNDATGGGLNNLLANPALQDALTELSACVRAGGYDVPDLTVAGALSSLLGGNMVGGSVNDLLSSMLGLDATDSAVQAAIDGCASDVEDQLNDLGL